jgi:hypothetical protein
VKKYILILSLAIATLSQAQTKDSISLGAGYAKQVYYSLQNGEQTTVDLSSWDLAFGTGAQGSVIRFNGATGNLLYTYPKGDVDVWSTVDTVGLSTWSNIYDSDTSWESSAFNKVTNNDFDLGWGVYSMITHLVSGDSIYIAKIGSKYKKFYIDRLQSSVYYLVHADLDGSNEATTAIAKADFKGKNFGYYSFTSNKSLDLEPLANSWDLVFTKYLTELPGYGAYGVTGVLSNKGVGIALVDDGSKINEVKSADFVFGYKINTIGYDWKSYVFADNAYSIEDSSIYVIKDVNGKNWNFELLAFEGSATGKVVFQLMDQSVVGLFDTQVQTSSMHVYPNPVDSGDEFKIDLGENAKVLSVEILNQNGQIVWQSNTADSNIPSTSLNSGYYLVSIQTTESTFTNRLIVK